MLLTTLGAGIAPCGGAAQNPPPDLDAVVAAALRANPDLLAARYRADSAHAEQRIARALPNPTYTAIPQVPYQHAFSEPIDVGPQRIYRTRAAGQGAAAAELDVADATRQVTFAVREVFHDLLLAGVLKDVATEQRDIFRQLLAADSARVRAGDVPERNLVTSEVQLARAEAGLVRAEAAVRGARLTLQALMGVPHPDTAFTVQGELRYQRVDLPVDSLQALAAQNRPDLAAARTRVEQSHALRTIAGSQLVPNPIFDVTYQCCQPFGNGRQYQFGVAVTFPLFYWFGGERQRARDAEQSATVQARRVETQLGADVVAALDAYRASLTLVDRYESGLLAKAERALELARYAYRAGAVSQLDLIEAIRAWADTRTDYYTALHDYWVSIYGLDRAVGRDLAP